MRKTSWEEPILSLRIYKYVKNLEFPKVAVGEKRPSSLLVSGLRFHVLGTFGSSCGKEQRQELRERKQNRI